MIEVDNTEDLLDIRDIIERIEALESERTDFANEKENAELAVERQVWSETTESGEELAKLESLVSDLKGYGGDHQWRGDWYPVTLIRHSYFVEAIEEQVKDIGDLPHDIPSYLVIDWEATADNLKVDYSTVDFDGVEYFYR
jgi:hypothetical protein